MQRPYYIVAVRIGRTDPFDISAELSEVPRKFGPHITLKGRFSIADKNELRDIMSFASEIANEILPIQLSPWIRITPSLVWRECCPYHDGYQKIRLIHVELLRYIRSKNYIEHTPEYFQGNAFRPHVTVQWQNSDIATEALATADQMCLAESFSLVLYAYRNHPFSSIVHAAPASR